MFHFCPKRSVVFTRLPDRLHLGTLSLVNLFTHWQVLLTSNNISLRAGCRAQGFLLTVDACSLDYVSIGLIRPIDRGSGVA